MQINKKNLNLNLENESKKKARSLGVSSGSSSRTPTAAKSPKTLKTLKNHSKEKEPLGTGLNQPSKLFLLLLNTKATLIQRWWRQRRLNAPSHIQDEIKNDDNVVELVEDLVLKRRKAKAEDARMEVLRELEMENKKMLKDTLDLTDKDLICVAAAAEPADNLPSTDVQSISKEESPSMDEIRIEDELPISSYIQITSSSEQDYLVDLDIQAVNDYYSQNREEATYEEDFEEFEPDQVENIKVENVVESMASIVPISDISIHLDAESTNPEELEEFLNDLDHRNCRDVSGKEEESSYIQENETVPVELKEKYLETQNDVKSIVAEVISEPTAPSRLFPKQTEKEIEKLQSPPPIIKKADTIDPRPEVIPDNTDKSVSRILSFLRSVDSQPVSLSHTHTATTPTIFDDVKHKIMASQLELSEKQKTILALKDQVARLKDTYKNDFADLQSKNRSQLALQRKEYETIVKRHLGFIDTVLAEKETLSAKVVELTEKVTKLEKSFHQKVVGMEESHLKHMTQQKELWQTQERIKRDKWITERTKQIKEQTVQGLEPEIQKLIATHKSALRNAEEEFRSRMQNEKTAMTESFQAQLDKLREKHVTDRQRACEEEREFARERYCKQLEREEMEFQQQKRKMQIEIEEERLSWSQSTKSQLQDLEVHHRKQIQNMQDSTSTLRDQHQKALSDQETKHHHAISDLKHKLDIEKEEWQSMFMKKTEVQVRAREKAFREQVVRERDAEIEVVIDRLESESGSSNSDATRRYRMDIERIKAETANEIKELRDQHSLALDKLLTANNKTSNLELEIRDLQKQVLKSSHAIMAKDSQLKSLKEQIERLGGDESSVISAIKRDYEDQSLMLKEKIQGLEDSVIAERQKAEYSCSQLRHALASVSKEKEDTIKMVEKQVRMSLANKDHAISLLKQECQEANQKLAHLEQMMDQQRSELLGL